MTPGIRPLVAGNWKMNGLRDNLGELKAIIDGVDTPSLEMIDTLICPPATLVYVATALAEDSELAIGAQDCHWNAAGAHTGDISAEMIADCLATHVIVGHSERRADHGEDDATVARKAEAAWDAGLVAIICIGETEAEWKSGETLAVLGRQLVGSVPDGAEAEMTIVAYEPVWAIGTGLTPTADDVAEAAASPNGLELALLKALKWAEKWGMTFGVAKCGLMVVNPIPSKDLVGDFSALGRLPARGACVSSS